jgi:alkanesulfonate monooxygenase SsuD/methylene tetrahydromethanopterin reductase-like flavin-dependent oxidoreductase (luciferase family)
MKRLWCDDVSEHKDEFYTLPACRMYPKPIQRPHPPLHFGGESDAALARVADLGDGWYGFDRTPEETVEGLERLTRMLGERGRVRGDVHVSVCPYLKAVGADDVKRYEDLGVDQVILFAAAADRDRLLGRLDTLAGLAV